MSDTVRTASGGRYSPWVLLFALSLLLAACGSAGDGASESTASDRTDEAAVEEDVAGADEDDADAVDGSAGTGGYFEGATLNFVVPYGPGGGYDQYARMIEPYLAEELGATIVMENETGAGGLIAANNTFNFDGAERDLRIQILPTAGTLTAGLTGEEGAQFVVEEFSFLGRVTGEPDAVVTTPDGRFGGFEDMLAVSDDEPVRFVSVGPGDIDYVNALVVEAAFGIPVEIITGFESGDGDASLAVTTGDADAIGRSLSGALRQSDAGEGRVIALYGSARDDRVPDVPTLGEFDPSAEGQAILDAHIAVIEGGRSLVGPPGIPDEALTELRDAFERVVNNPDFLAESEERNLPIGFLTGADMQNLIENLIATVPDDYLALISAD